MTLATMQDLPSRCVECGGELSFQDADTCPECRGGTVRAAEARLMELIETRGSVRAVAVRDGPELIFCGPGGAYAVRRVFHSPGGIDSYPLMAGRPPYRRAESGPDEHGVYAVQQSGEHRWVSDFAELADAIRCAAIYAVRGRGQDG